MATPSRSPKGSALIAVILIITLLLALSALLVKMVYNDSASAHLAYEKAQAFWLAEAGLEKGKVELSHNGDWYTDLPHSPRDDAAWLIKTAVGQTTGFGAGRFKVVREKGGSDLYAVGFAGRGVAVLRSGPDGWREL